MAAAATFKPEGIASTYEKCDAIGSYKTDLNSERKKITILKTIAVVLIALGAIGALFFSGYTLYGLLCILHEVSFVPFCSKYVGLSLFLVSILLVIIGSLAAYFACKKDEKCD